MHSGTNTLRTPADLVPTLSVIFLTAGISDTTVFSHLQTETLGVGTHSDPPALFARLLRYWEPPL